MTPPIPCKFKQLSRLGGQFIGGQDDGTSYDPPFCANLINCHVLAASSLAARMMEYDPPIPCKFNQLSRLGGQFTGGQDDGI